MNNYFHNIATELDSQLVQNEISPYAFVTRNLNPSSFFLSPVSPYECSYLIRNLKITKSDINVMPVKMFSALHEYVSMPVSELINASFVHGTFPSMLKVARVTPVYKRGCREDPSNYRPISSLPYLSKIFERSIVNQLNSFLTRHKIISNSQFGFQRNISTKDALISLTESIYDSLNDKKHHLSILIDIKKAFDTMNHKILLRKLEMYGIRGLPLAWIRSYLSDRISFVSVGNASSSAKVSNIGIPQGSIIGPLLFILFINDLPNVSTKFSTCLFADDTTLSICHTCDSELIQLASNELSRIWDWNSSNRLTINVAKTEAILFTNKVFDRENNKINLNGEILPYSNSCRFLGIYLDENLNFSSHVNYLVGRIARNTDILHSIRENMPKYARVDYYYGMIYPYLFFNILIWGSTYDVH